jgi:Concanavalin A-like lectin/glucanases superfamily
MSYFSTILAEPTLVSYWEMQETSGITAHDFKSSNNGTYNGSFILNQSGYFATDNAVLFDGSSAFISIPSNINLEFTENFTLEAWIKTTASTTGAGIICKTDPVLNPNGYLIAEYHGQLGVYLSESTGWIESTTPINDGYWHYIVVTIASSGAVNIYIDTYPDTQATSILSPFSKFPFYIGCNGSNSVFFNGLISNVAVYNSILTSFQIYNHYVASTINFGLTTSTIFEIQTTGNDTNGGGFDPTIGTTDYTNGSTQQTIVFDGSRITASTSGASATITITGYTVQASDVGNVLNITGGINFTIFYFTIISINTGSNTWTLYSPVSTGIASGLTGICGGALASLRQADKIAHNAAINLQCFIKGGTYSFNVANSYIGFANCQFIMGYTSNRIPFNNDVRPIFVPTQNSFTIVNHQGIGYCIIGNIDIQNPSAHTNITAYNFPSNFYTLYRLNASNCYWSFQSTGTNNNNTFLYCSSINASHAAFFGNYFDFIVNNFYYCCAVVNGGNFNGGMFGPDIEAGNTGLTKTGSVAINCLVAGDNSISTGAAGAFIGFNVCINCVAHNVLATGAVAFKNITSACINCIVNGVSTYGFNTSYEYFDINTYVGIINCAARGCGVGFTDQSANYNFINPIIALTGDPFVASGQTTAADFTVTLASGLQSGAADLFEFAGIASLTFGDLGCIRHQDPLITPVNLAQIIWNDLLSSSDFTTTGSIGALIKANINASIGNLYNSSLLPPNLTNLEIDSSGRTILQPTGFDSITAWNTTTARQAIFYASAGVFGEVTGMNTGSATIKGLDGSTTTAVIHFDKNNNRTSVTLTPP